MRTAKSRAKRSHRFGVSGPIRRLAGLGNVIVGAPQVRQRSNDPGLLSIRLPRALKPRLGRGRLFTPVVRVEHCDLSARHDSSNTGYGADSSDYPNFSNDPSPPQWVAKQPKICLEPCPCRRVTPELGRGGKHREPRRSYAQVSNIAPAVNTHTPGEIFRSLSRAS